MKYSIGKLVYLFTVMVLGIFLLAGCGSKGGKGTDGGDDGDGGGETPTPTPTFNFTGTVYSGNGNSAPQVKIHAIQNEDGVNTTVTNADGQFSMDISEEMHTVLGTRSGLIPTFRLADLSSGDAVEQSLLLQTAAASSVSINAQVGGSVNSNTIDGQRARLNVAPQPDGVFDVFNGNGRSDASSASVNVEYINLSIPLPVPLPSPDTLAANDVIIGGKQAPASMVFINPPLLKMDAAGELILPNPGSLSNVRILHFDPYEHRWEVAGETDDTPADGTAVSVSDGGVYGIFYEESRTGTVRGTATPGSFVYVGDEVVRVLSDGTFYFGEVPIPPSGQLKVVAVGPDGELIERTLNIEPGDILTISLAVVEINAIDLTAVDEEITADGQATTTVKATVLDVNQDPALDGTEVVFSSTAGSLSCPPNGTAGCNVALSGIRAQTENGVARVVLQSSTIVETATVTGTVAGLSDTVAVDFAAGSPYSAELYADPVNLTANGSQQSTIEAIVYDAAGHRLEGRNVLFELSAPNMGQLSESVVTTTAGGLASTVFTTSTQTGDVAVSVKDENGNPLKNQNNETENAEITITLIGAQVASITASTGAPSIVADGETMVLVAAEVNDFEGQAVSDGTKVTFTTTAGTFQGTTNDAGTRIDPTTIGGRATAQLISPTNVGTATVTITAGGVWAAAEVGFDPGAPAMVTASASPSKLTLGQDVGSTITMTVRDAYDNFVPGATLTIRDREMFGAVDSGTAVTDAGGTATVNYTPPSLVPDGGKDEVKIVATNGVETTVEIQLVGPRIAGIQLSLEPSSLPADGESQAIVSAVLTMVGGDPAPDDTPVYFGVVSGGGGFVGGIAQSFTVGGEAIARLTADNEPGTATIRVGTDKYAEEVNGEQTERIGGIVQEIDIDYTPGSISLLIAPDIVLGTGQQSCKDGTALNCAEIIATLELANGDPAIGEEVTFSLQSSAGMSRTGTIELQNDGLSDDAGRVSAWYIAPNEGGEITITATWVTDNVEVTETGTITINPPPASINVAPPDQTEISVRGTGGQETVQLFFEVKDNAGNPVQDGYRIDFEILTGPGGGELLTPIFDLTEGEGRVGTVLRSGYESGPVSVKATYFHNSNVSTVVSQIVIKAGPPVGEEFGISAQYNNISGLSYTGLENLLIANAGDYYGNAVPDGTAISFKTYNTGGLIEEGEQNTNTAGGFSNSTLFSTPTPRPLEGGVSITAEAVGGRTTHITSLDLAPVDFAARDRYILFAGTDGGGVYKSLDSGKTWENRSRSSSHPGQNWIYPYVNDISIDRDETNIVYAATGFLGQGNIYRSLDGGLTWNSGSAEEWIGLKSYPLSDLNSISSAVSTVLCDYDDDAVPYREYPWVWAGTENDGILYSEDGVIFKRAEVLGKGRNINDIVRIVDTHGADAILYAATSSGIYKSYPKDAGSGGGRQWFYKTTDSTDGAPNSFPGDHVNSLALHSSADGGVSDILYAGTEDAGVWVSTDSGKSWKYYTEGLGEGLMATIPAGDIRNQGTGRVTDVTVGKKTLSENWTLEYEEYAVCVENSDGRDCEQGACPEGECEQTAGGFTITGSDTGVIPDPDQPDQPDHAMEGQRYEVASVDLAFTIVEGNIPFEPGDKFTFTTIRNPGLNIKQLLLDETNNRLYATTYFEPEGFHPVGNLYYHDLKSDRSGFMKEGGLWLEASEGLPQFDPPDDATLFAQHAMSLAQGPFGETKSLFIGGEGISFHKADSGLSNESLPDWTASRSGMNNTIMARTFVLFSGAASMSFELVAINSKAGDNIWETGDPLPVAVEDENELIFEAFVQDEYGNPPIGGSSFTVETSQQRNVYSIIYPDSLIYPGTWRDTTDERTRNPFVIRYIYNADTDGGLVFEFDPDCPTGEITAPGCSGSLQQITIQLPIIRSDFWSF